MTEFEARVRQYMRPSGRVVETSTMLPMRVKVPYEEMRADGYRFAAEVLSTEEVSVMIENDTRDADIRVCGNGPLVQAGMEAMLQDRKWQEGSGHEEL